MVHLLVKSGQQRRDIEASGGLARLFEAVTILVTELHRVQKRQLVLIFDEAQDLAEENLLHLKRLSNLNGEIEGRITMVLIGQPELREQAANVPPLDQRISLRFHLPNLARDEVESYLRHRLRVAGHATSDIFTPDAAALLYQASRGVPRDINRIAKLSLESAASSGISFVDHAQVNSVVEDLRRHQSLPAVFANRP
jgi:type II secretory pathway predicted ATPase ExeA